MGEVNDDPRMMVPLNLEETGRLCHLILQQPEVAKAAREGKGHPVVVRMLELYGRLSLYNDALMDKFWTFTEAQAAARAGMCVTRDEWRGSYLYWDEGRKALGVRDYDSPLEYIPFDYDEPEEQATNYRLWTTKDIKE